MSLIKGCNKFCSIEFKCKLTMTSLSACSSSTMYTPGTSITSSQLPTIPYINRVITHVLQAAGDLSMQSWLLQIPKSPRFWIRIICSIHEPNTIAAPGSFNNHASLYGAGFTGHTNNNSIFSDISSCNIIIQVIVIIFQQTPWKMMDWLLGRANCHLCVGNTRNKPLACAWNMLQQQECKSL